MANAKNAFEAEDARGQNMAKFANEKKDQNKRRKEKGGKQVT